jgi:hypothetical protein
MYLDPTVLKLRPTYYFPLQLLLLIYCDVLVGNTSNNLRTLGLMPDLLVIRQAELQLIITIAVSL